jgi:murein DD-endopeptidase MepM/ murein hydrolase activator NlpD
MAPRRDLHGRYLAVVAAVGLGLALMTSYGITMAKESDGADSSGPSAVLSLVEIPKTAAIGTARVLRSEPIVPQVGEAAAYVPPLAAVSQIAGRQPGSSSFDADGPAFIRYTVESGDSLTSIANQFQICPDHILWNNENTGESLRAGDDLLLPGYPGLLHEMRKGEKLDEVAARYNTTVAKVIAYPGNHLKSAQDAKEHTLILLPGGFPSSALADTAEGAATYRPPSEYGYIWPFFGPITTRFGEPRPGYIHTAIDIGGLGRWGAPVSAIAAGRVIQVEHLQNGLGNYVVIEHPDGSRSLYAHLAETWVEPGDTVQQGAHVGPIGCTGLSTGTHLHFQLWRDGEPVDPLLYLPLLDASGQPQN